jgi:2-polyprenyl-3-methyl-5-hydroxy-6-metoxy-1,4-benzoquinol methylase
LLFGHQPAPLSVYSRACNSAILESLISSGSEREFYDTHYAQFLRLPDHALRIDRQILEASLENPSQPFYERRLLYRAAMRALEAQSLRGRKILDYGCGPADFGLWMATEGADVTLLDISPAAIELALRRAHASAVVVRGIAADASRLSMLGEGEFDLVFACAALHHTLKYPGALAELARIMRPGARLVLAETWGGNPLLNAARKLRARASGEVPEQGEGIIFSRRELRALDPFFEHLRVEPMNLLAMGKRMLRGRFDRSWARLALSTLEFSDRLLLALAPPLRSWCGEAVVTGQRRIGS